MRMICGKGYNPKGVHLARYNGKTTKAYSTWHSMVQRCYCRQSLIKRPTYAGCIVADEWLNFQVFAEWYKSHKYYDTGYHLDKDLLIPNNRVYSPETCVLVPQELNSLLTDCGKSKGKHPQGVCYNKQKKRYQANIRMNGAAIYLGRFDCPQEAYEVYKTTKEAYVKERALHWRDRIAPEVFDALMVWKL